MGRQQIRSETAGLWKRGEIWWLARTLPGWGRVRMSLGVSDLPAAIAKSRLIAAFPGRYLGENPESDDVAAYLAHLEKSGISKAWRDFAATALKQFAEATGAALDRVTVPAARRWWDGQTTKEKTRKEYLLAIQRFYRWAVDTGRVRQSPVAEIVPPKIRPQPRRKFLTPAQADLVIAECSDEDLGFALRCALWAGMRKGEVIASRPHWFDVEARTIHVQNEADWLTKDRDNRAIPMKRKFAEFLKGYGLRSPYMLRPDVLPSAKNKTWRYRTDFAKAFNNHMERLGLSEFTFHDLRRTFASLLVSKGVSIYKVAQWLGDGVEVVESTYARLIPADDDIDKA